MKKRILIIGSLNMDMVIEMKKMPLIGETVLGKTLSYVPGGKGANQAYAAGKSGGDVIMLGCVGDDSMGDALMKSISHSGANVSNIAKVEGKPTGTAVIYVNEKGDNSIVVVSGANGFCDVEYLKENDFLFGEAEYVMLQMEIPHEAVYYAIKRAKELGKTVILNPAPAPEELPESIWDKIDYITPNETELMQLSNHGASDKETGASIEEIEGCAARLLEKGVKNVLVTLGDKGALLVNNNRSKMYPARKVMVMDTTAAGDCFNGAFVAALAGGTQEGQAILFANAASSISVTRKGAQSSIPDKGEVEQLLGSMAQTLEYDEA